MSQATKQAPASGLQIGKYWVVSPNVRDNEGTVADWRQASLRECAAFMGYGPQDHGHSQIGQKFAGTTERGVMPGDVILIARRHHHEPEIVGFGVVKGEHARKTRFKPPQEFGSLRKLSPFIPWSRPQSGIPLIDVLKHTKSLVQLHPEKDESHKKVCEWMAKGLGSKAGRSGNKSPAKGKFTGNRKSNSTDPSIVDRPQSHQLDYKVQTRSKVIRAKKIEAALVDGYARWLERQDRKLEAAKYANLQCDGYEEARHNLIEAKSSTTREHIRMAVGQLLDYAFQGKAQLGDANKAILLPKKPAPSLVEWLQPLKIHIIWREGGAFFDDANGQFT